MSINSVLNERYEIIYRRVIECQKQIRSRINELQRKRNTKIVLQKRYQQNNK